MSMRRAKALGDARHGWAQLAAILAVLTLAIGGAVGALDARAILEREIRASFAAAEVPDLALWLDAVDADTLARVAREPGVAAVDARRVVNTRVLSRDGTWLPMRITVRTPPATLGRVHAHRPLAGDEGLAVEQSGEELLTPGPTVRLRKPGGETAEVWLRGFVHDPAVAPSGQDKMIYAYATPALAGRLGYAPALDQLLVKMEARGSTGEAAELGARLGEALAQVGARPARIEALAAAHPHMPLNLAMVRVLAILGAIAAVCGAAVSGYLISAWMRREVRIIGILKTLGARAHQVAAQYILLLAPLAALGAALGFALGSAISRVVVALEANVTNIDVASLDVPRSLTLIQVAIAFAIPLVAMAFPVARAARMRPLASLQDAGIVVPGVTARIVARVVRVRSSAAWTLALRNVGRRPWRTAIMVVALASGGAMLLVSKTTYVSIMAAVDRSLAHEGHDVELVLQKPQPGAAIAAIAAAVPGVALAEPWQRAGVSASTGAHVDTESARFTLVGYPARSQLFVQPLAEGRAPASAGEALATRSLLEIYPGLAVGRSLTVRFRQRVSTVRITGIIEPIGPPALFAPEDTYRTITGMDDAIAVRAKARPGTRLDALSNDLESAFIDVRLVPAQVVSRSLIRDSLDEHVEVVGGLMRAVALAAALIGAVILVAAVAFNVAERRREVGILRALGASAPWIRSIFMIESNAILAVGAVLGIAASLAIARAILDAGERSLLRVAIPMQLSLEGLAWLAASALVVFLAIRLSLTRALRASAREALASE